MGFLQHQLSQAGPRAFQQVGAREPRQEVGVQGFQHQAGEAQLSLRHQQLRQVQLGRRRLLRATSLRYRGLFRRNA